MSNARPSPQSPLVGRDRELRALRTQLNETLAGRGSLVLISGEAGIGKTALLGGLAHSGAGAHFLVGHCYDRAETPPYGPWLESLARFGDECRRQDLAIPPLPRLAEAASQGEFFEQVRAFFVALAADRPVVLTLEDLHWADAASLDLLRSLARAVPSLPLLVAVTYRADELGRSHPLYALIPILVRESSATRLDLRPLDLAATRELVDARYDLSEDEAARLAAYLVGRTEGNALFMTELLRTLEEEQLLHRDDGHWRTGPLERAPMPLLLRQVIDARLARLDDEAVALLAVAAVIGQEVPLTTWQAATLADEETLIALTERSETAHLLAARDDGVGVRFTHALIRDALYESVPAFRRRHLHRQVGDVLAGSPTPAPDAVAHHFQRAGDERAVAWLVEAATRAEDAYALVAASERYDAAIALLDQRRGDAGERGWLRLLDAALCRFQDPERARVRVEEAMLLAATAADASLGARAQALQGLLHGYRGKLRTAMEYLAAAANAIDRLPPGRGVARRRELQIDKIANRGTLINCLAYSGRLAEARAQGERYLATFDSPAPTPEEIGAVADVQGALAMAYALQGEPLLAKQANAAATAAYDAIGLHLVKHSKLREALMLGVLRYEADDLPERERVADAADRAARHLIAIGAHDEADDPRHIRLALLGVEGRWREARQIAERANTTNLSDDLHWHNFVLGPLARAQGDAERARRCVAEAWPGGPATEPGDCFVPWTVPLQLLAAVLALDEDDLATARAWLDAHARWLTWMGATLGRSEGEAKEAEWHRATGDAARAREHAEAALRHATAPRQPLALLAAHRLLGTLATDAGETALAEDHFATALALADRCRAPYERALILLARAECTVAQGDRLTIAAMLEEARAICAGLDARPALARVDALVARLPVRSVANQTLPGGLSAREVEVLRLVADGLTNAQVAERLFLSPRTVNGHLTAIYAKLGVEGRAAAIRIALDHGLR